MTSVVQIIAKKRDKKSLTNEDLHSFFGAYLKGEIEDYQMSAMLMAININGMNQVETAALTKIMRDSGTVLTWPYNKNLIVDKHSTGGVGDKTSLVILPLCTLEGVKVPMMSGRGLGHTGGTLDKLESIPNTEVQLPIEKAMHTVEKYGGVFIGQTAQLAPLDKKLYAMRDVTGTVESIPLITASILSKKTAEGIGNLVMDVKHGSGAFMTKYEDAQALAESLHRVGKECGLKIRCLLTNMDSPLGRAAGNNLEVIECVEILQGKGAADTTELTLDLCVEMLQMTSPNMSRETIQSKLHKNLENGKAFERFCEIIADQGGDISYLENTDKFPKAKHQKAAYPKGDGKFVQSVDVRGLGYAIVALGGGRRVMTDKVDPAVGLTEMKHVGESVGPNEPLAIVHANDPGKLAQAVQMIEQAYTLGPSATSYKLVTKRFE